MTSLRNYLSIAAAVAITGNNVASALAASFPRSSSLILEDRADSTQWKTVLEIGSSKWHIGDAVSQDFEKKFMKNVCSSTGCDAGTPQTFQYLTKSGGYTALGKGTITMEGNSNNDTAVIDNLLDAVSAALVASSQCSTTSAEMCMNNPSPSDTASQWTKRESGGIALDCGKTTFNDCYLVNYIQATMYDDQSNQKAQVTFNGASEDPQGLDCDSILGVISDALGAIAPLELTGVEEISGLTSGISALCTVL
ncbi:hypothetical protein M406DRAFT_67192 [Cryphonectria parasitica EP155]|uniref:Uncharacterized protein n=1 Tax=Cryphonectria parasitica (strain ATCC 38755 / EP155) TaxID=660469 RepID=A0A9P5CTN4_CRYP1|nr:uncharacterized protein M406DRAFT_67192 [Cryphonectria parasitica EP155]KAF3770824.1 hypothetical protein M406DRAFT_67192 [Cryphonectria parasitica EP155]